MVHKHVFSVVVILFAVGGTIVPAPPPAAIVSHVQDVLALLKSTPDAVSQAE